MPKKGHSEEQIIAALKQLNRRANEPGPVPGFDTVPVQ